MQLQPVNLIDRTLAPTLVRDTQPSAENAAGASSFGALLSQLSADAAKTLHQAEAASLGGIEGKMSVQQVVDQVMEAERTLQTAIAVRDKAIQAYHDITNMAI